MFQQPSQGGDKVPFGDMIGDLVLIQVHEIRPGIATAFGEKEAIAADVHDLQGRHGGEVFENTLIFQGALIGALKSAVGGEPVLGRVGQGVAKPGQNPPFILQPFTDADVVIAGPYWQKRQASQFKQAAPTDAAAPAANPATAGAAATNGMSAEAFQALPPEVQELIRQSAT